MPAFAPLRRAAAAAAVATVSLGTCLAAAPAAHAAAAWRPDAPTWDVLQQKNVPITMSDGVVLRANVGIPVPKGATAPAPGLHFPVLVEQTPYRKDGGLFTVDPYFVQRGYAMVVVDVRGTGSSDGEWDSFGPREQEDGPAVVRWAAHQPWANGTAGLMGASYLAINQLLTMEQDDAPSEVRAIFPVVPMSDAYRDVTYHGGNLDAGFIPPWLGLVTALGAPPAGQTTDGSPQDLQDGLTVALNHASGALAFQVPQTLGSAAGGAATYDDAFYQVRSPILRINRVRVPAFVVGGEFDIFQRAEPLLYTVLPTEHKRLLVGPWIHLEGAEGMGLPADGIPTLKELQLQWFDQYLRGQDTGEDTAPRVLQYDLQGVQPSHFVASSSYPLSAPRPLDLYLAAGPTGSAHSLNDGALGTAPPAKAGSDPLPYNPVGTGCTRTTFQWGDASGSMAGADTLPCETDERVNEVQALTYTTPPLQQPLTVNGPINVHLVADDANGGNTTFTVRLCDVAPDGRSTQVTAGWLLASQRAESPNPVTLAVDGRLLRVFHPYAQQTDATPPAHGAYDIEVFPTLETFQPGHRIRLDVSTGDMPHMVPSLPHQAQSLGSTFMVDHNPADPSFVTLPVVATPASACGAGCAGGSGAGAGGSGFAPSGGALAASSLPNTAGPAVGGGSAAGVAAVLGAAALRMAGRRRRSVRVTAAG